MGTPIFEDDEEGPRDGDGDGGTTARAADPTPFESSDDDYPPITSTATIDVPTTSEEPAADAREVTS